MDTRPLWSQDSDSSLSHCNLTQWGQQRFLRRCCSAVGTTKASAPVPTNNCFDVIRVQSERWSRADNASNRQYAQHSRAAAEHLLLHALAEGGGGNVHEAVDGSCAKPAVAFLGHWHSDCATSMIPVQATAGMSLTALVAILRVQPTADAFAVRISTGSGAQEHGRGAPGTWRGW